MLCNPASGILLDHPRSAQSRNSGKTYRGLDHSSLSPEQSPFPIVSCILPSPVADSHTTFDSPSQLLFLSPEEVLLLLLSLSLSLPLSVFVVDRSLAVISTEAAHSLIVSSAVERPPHFALAVAFNSAPYSENPRSLLTPPRLKAYLTNMHTLQNLCCCRRSLQAYAEACCTR